MYYIVYGFLYLLSLLPLRVLYFLSDAVYGLVYYIFRYRKDIVMNNLLIALPEKTEKERVRIAKDFYHNLIDTFIETIKMITASESFIEKRFTANWEVVNDLYASGRNCQLHLGHNFNWEWGNVIGAKKIMHSFMVVYMPITNKIFDKLFFDLRSRTGTILIPATNMKKNFKDFKDKQYILGLAADQNPGDPSGAWWVNFFGRLTPFVKGPEKAAVTNNTDVVFAFIHKPKRGYYEAVFTLAAQNPASLQPGELTKTFVHYLENVIRENPSMWLWSHRRWKWEYDEKYKEQVIE